MSLIPTKPNFWIKGSVKVHRIDRPDGKYLIQSREIKEAPLEKIAIDYSAEKIRGSYSYRLKYDYFKADGTSETDVLEGYNGVWSIWAKSVEHISFQNAEDFLYIPK